MRDLKALFERNAKQDYQAQVLPQVQQSVQALFSNGLDHDFLFRYLHSWIELIAPVTGATGSYEKYPFKALGLLHRL